MVVKRREGFSVQAAIVIEIAALLGWALDRTGGAQHWVGDSVWSIPTSKEFYNNWSSTHSFLKGDSLYFDFETELYDVMQVSKRDYEGCVAKNPFRTYAVGPATVPLTERGTFYFICSVGNYCALGQKLSVIVNPCCEPYLPSPAPSPSPLSPSDPNHPATPEPEPPAADQPPAPDLAPSPPPSPPEGGGGAFNVSAAIERRYVYPAAAGFSALSLMMCSFEFL